ncbi:MAG: hypothetical protein QNJ72_06820 [Pleurocapsa sp. MO_226.B13]|nr:hypothetical protein [Pleurocapsa sp. MO_226.B13]
MSVQCLRIIFSETVHECLGFLSGKGIRAGQKAAWENIPCHGDVWHIFDQCTTLCSNLAKKAQGATTQRSKLEPKMESAKLKGKGNKLSALVNSSESK